MAQQVNPVSGDGGTMQPLCNYRELGAKIVKDCGLQTLPAEALAKEGCRLQTLPAEALAKEGCRLMAKFRIINMPVVITVRFF